MPKVRINSIAGRPATSSVWLDNGGRLRAGETADIDDLTPYQHLIDSGVLVTVAGRPKRVATDATNPSPDPN